MFSGCSLKDFRWVTRIVLPQQTQTIIHSETWICLPSLSRLVSSAHSFNEQIRDWISRRTVWPQHKPRDQLLIWLLPDRLTVRCPRGPVFALHKDLGRKTHVARPVTTDEVSTKYYCCLRVKVDGPLLLRSSSCTRGDWGGLVGASAYRVGD
jgi:hypothetical protein